MQALQNGNLKHKDFPERVQVEYNHQLPLSPDPSSPIVKLLTLKDAIRKVNDNIGAQQQVSHSDDLEDHLGWSIMHLRAMDCSSCKWKSHGFFQSIERV